MQALKDKGADVGSESSAGERAARKLPTGVSDGNQRVWKICMRLACMQHISLGWSRWKGHRTNLRWLAVHRGAHTAHKRSSSTFSISGFENRLLPVIKSLLRLAHRSGVAAREGIALGRLHKAQHRGACAKYRRAQRRAAAAPSCRSPARHRVGDRAERAPQTRRCAAEAPAASVPLMVAASPRAHLTSRAASCVYSTTCKGS